MDLIANSKEQVAAMVADVLAGIKDGLATFQATHSIPAGLAFDPQTGHAYVDVTVQFVPGLNAFAQESVQGAQTDASQTDHGEGVTEAAESGGDSSTTRYIYGEV